MRNVDAFTRELELARKRPDPDHGGLVFPVARIFSGLANEAELGAFRQAITRMLASSDEGVQRWAASACSGFVYFSTSIEPPAFAQRPKDAPMSKGASVGTGPTREAGDFFRALSDYAAGQARVDDAVRLYGEVQAGKEAVAFLDAIERMLSSSDERLRRYGIDVCLDFVLRGVSPPPAPPEGPTQFIVHSREPFRLNPNLTLRARKLVTIHLPREILSPEGTPLSEIVRLSNQNAKVGLVEPKPGGGVAAMIFELEPGDEICLTRSAQAMVDDGTENGVIVFDAQAA